MTQPPDAFDDPQIFGELMAEAATFHTLLGRALNEWNVARRARLMGQVLVAGNGALSTWRQLRQLDVLRMLADEGDYHGARTAVAEKLELSLGQLNAIARGTRLGRPSSRYRQRGESATSSVDGAAT